MKFAKIDFGVALSQFL